MARSTKGLYKRVNTWWMTYRDSIGTQRFESCKTSNKKEAERRLIDRRKESMDGVVPAPPMKPLALEDLQERYLSFVGHNREWLPSTFTLLTSIACGGIPLFMPSRRKCWTSTGHDDLWRRSALRQSIEKWRP